MKPPSVLALAIMIGLSPAKADPQYRVEKSYEDTVRILVLTNADATGNPDCGAKTRPVGPLTRDFTLGALVGIPNVVSRNSGETTWEAIAGIWPGKLPHVIVHVNAGWYTENGPYANDILNRAADLRIGVVSIGDDAANFADKIFGFADVVNEPEPMGAAIQYRKPGDRLWISLDGKSDTLPGNGVIRNTAVKMGVKTLEFKPYGTDESGDYRCEADADKYTILPEYVGRLLPLGFQRAYDGTDTIGSPREYQAIVAFQDEARRGVALSFEPQFLVDKPAAEQIVYDAVLFSSYAHLYNITPSVRFTDETGTPLADDAYWNPSKGKVYLTYTDDFLSPPSVKELRLKVVNRRGTAMPDSETVILKDPQIGKGEGIWKVEIPLAEGAMPREMNGVLDMHVLGEVSASIMTHGPGGVLDGGMVTDRMSIAYPNLPESLKVVNRIDPAIPVAGSTGRFGISLAEQSFSGFQDTVYVDVRCAQSGDSLSRVALVETSAGNYASGDLAKIIASANPKDGILSCLYSDRLVVSYVDEVYGTMTKVETAWSADGIRLFLGYPPVRNSSADISGFAGGYDFLSRAGVDRLAGGSEGLKWVQPTDYLGPSATDNGRLGPLPRDISTILVVSAGRYVARVSIFDNLGQHVRDFTQAFGFRGELENPERMVAGGRAGFLVWDMRDNMGNRVGNGAYIWHVAFTLGDGSVQIRRTTMGILRGFGS